MNIYLDYYFSYFILLLYYFVKIKKVYLIHFKKKKKKKKKSLDDCYVIIFKGKYANYINYRYIYIYHNNLERYYKYIS